MLQKVQLLLMTLCAILNASAQNYSDHIHVDQFGYKTNATKVAVISNPQSGYNAGDSFTPSSTLQLIDNLDESLVLSGPAEQWQGGNTDGRSGDKGWWFDFSTVTTPGEYYVLDPIQNVRSDFFEINDGVYDTILKEACRAFYYNRCNMPKEAPYAEPNWVDGDNFNNPSQDTDCIDLNDQSNPSRRKDLSGGWWDAGDNNKYVTFASDPVHNLLSAYESYPDVFPDNWNIPESSNGIPDIMDEIDWEVQWLKKMQETDGRVIIKMGNIDYNHNALTPPSLNTDPRYYGPSCTSSTMAFAGMVAHAAITYSTISGLSAQTPELETAAVDAWDAVIDDFNNGTLDYNCDDGTIKSGDADRNDTEQRELALIAAVYLFELTDNAEYNNYVIDHIYDASNVSGGWWGPYTVVLNEALLRYTTLPGADQNTSNIIINSFQPHVQGDWDGFYGFNENDLYRAYAADYMYGWGSNNTLSNLATLNTQAVDYGIDPANEDDLNHKAEEMVHYFHGVNPQNIVYLSNMGSHGAEYSANEIYHFWFWDGTDYDNAQTSLYGPAPGFLAGGANKDFSVSWLSPPAGQPITKSYKDWNTSNPEKSWEITEPAIYYQAAYIRLLARFASESALLPVELVDFTASNDNLDVRLNWSTATEMGSDFFAIERSTDNVAWTEIGSEDAAGDSAERLEYEYTDHNAWNGNEEQWYYRLKMVDVDGQEEYSSVRAVTRVVTGNELIDSPMFSLYPNPSSGKFYIQTISQDPAVVGFTCSIFSSDGQLVKTIKASNNAESVHINLSNYPAGMYILKMTADRISEEVKLVLL